MRPWLPIGAWPAALHANVDLDVASGLSHHDHDRRSGWATRQLAEFLGCSAAAPTSVRGRRTSRLLGVFIRGGRLRLPSTSSGHRVAWLDRGPRARRSSPRPATSRPGSYVPVSAGVKRSPSPSTGTRDPAPAGPGRHPFTAEEVGLLRAWPGCWDSPFACSGPSPSSGSTWRRTNVTSRKTALVALSGTSGPPRTTAQIQHKISSRQSLQEVLDAITAGAAELLGDEVVALRLIDETDPDVMVMVSSVGISSELLAQFGRLPVGTGVGGRAIVEDRLCVAEDYPEATARSAPSSITECRRPWPPRSASQGGR